MTTYHEREARRGLGRWIILGGVALAILAAIILVLVYSGGGGGGGGGGY